MDFLHMGTNIILQMSQSEHFILRDIPCDIAHFGLKNITLM